MTELELRQTFKNLSDCYADTRYSERGFMQEGEVIQAMTEDRFIELLKEVKLLPLPATADQSNANQILSNHVSDSDVRWRGCKDKVIDAMIAFKNLNQ